MVAGLFTLVKTRSNFFSGKLAGAVAADFNQIQFFDLNQIQYPPP
jgi:hypothetical protein